MKFLILEAVDHFFGTWSTSHQMPLELFSYKALCEKWVLQCFECLFLWGEWSGYFLGPISVLGQQRELVSPPWLNIPSKKYTNIHSFENVLDPIAEQIKQCATNYPAADLGSGISASWNPAPPEGPSSCSQGRSFTEAILKVQTKEEQKEMIREFSKS